MLTKNLKVFQISSTFYKESTVKNPKKQGFGSVTIWYVSRSADPYHEPDSDPDSHPDPAPDSAPFVSDLQVFLLITYFFKAHLHLSLKIKSHKA
jgi:hypothetical protein